MVSCYSCLGFRNSMEYKACSLSKAVPSHSFLVAFYVRLRAWEGQGALPYLDCAIPQQKSGPRKDSHSPSPVLGSHSWFLAGLGHVCCLFSFPFLAFGVFRHFPVEFQCSALDNILEVWLSTHRFASSKWIKHAWNAPSQPSWTKKK